MSLTVEIKVIPSSGRQKLILTEPNKFKCYIKSQPEKGKANDEIIKFISKKLSIPQNSIVILSGKTSRNKKIKISLDITYKDFLKKFNLN
jgi:uncharacterized protein